MISFTRILTVVMFAVLCFGVIVPRALASGNTPLAIGMGVLFVLYLAANAILWKRMRPRA